MKSIENLLSQMTSEQKAPIVKILGLKINDNDAIKEKLSKILLPAGGILQSSISYNQFLQKIAEQNNEKIDLSYGDVKAETNLYLQLFQQEFEKLSPEEKEKIYQELEKAGLDKNQITSLSGVSTLGVAQLSGFGVYLLASSTVGAITSVLGITLPFAFYTGMSSIISFVIGPVGFLVMGVMIYRSFKNVKSWDEALDMLKNSWTEMKNFALGDYTRGTLAFKYIASTRVILTENYKNEIFENKSKNDIEKEKIYEFNDNISRFKSNISNVLEQVDYEEISAIKIQGEIQEKKIHLDSINKEISKLNSVINELDSEIKSIKNSIQNKEKEISATNNRSLLLESKIKDLEN